MAAGATACRQARLVATRPAAGAGGQRRRRRVRDAPAAEPAAAWPFGAAAAADAAAPAGEALATTAGLWAGRRRRPRPAAAAAAVGANGGCDGRGEGRCGDGSGGGCSGGDGGGGGCGDDRDGGRRRLPVGGGVGAAATAPPAPPPHDRLPPCAACGGDGSGGGGGCTRRRARRPWPVGVPAEPAGAVAGATGGGSAAGVPADGEHPPRRSAGAAVARGRDRRAPAPPARRCVPAVAAHRRRARGVGASLALALALVLAIVGGTPPGAAAFHMERLPDVYELHLQATDACPKTVVHETYTTTRQRQGYVRLFHNSILMDGTRCEGRQLYPYTNLITADLYERVVHNVSAAGHRGLARMDAVPTDTPLLRALLETRALFGAETDPRVCGKTTLRNGTLVAFVHNETAPFLGEEAGYKYMLLWETRGENPLKCWYRGMGANDKDKPVPARLLQRRLGVAANDLASSASQCFPADAVVHTAAAVAAPVGGAGGGAFAAGGTVRIRDLAVGDTLAVHPAAGAAAPTDGGVVHAFSHADPAVLLPFLSLTTASGASVTLTGGHFLWVNGVPAPAESVRVGDTLHVLPTGANGTVVRVEAVMAAGAYAPHPLGGELVVGGVRVSAYTAALRPAVAHALLAPARAAWRAGLRPGGDWVLAAANAGRPWLDRWAAARVWAAGGGVGRR